MTRARTALTALIAGLIALTVSMCSGTPAYADTYGWSWDHSPGYTDRTHSKYVKAGLDGWDSPVSGLSMGRGPEVTVDYGALADPAWAAQAEWWFNGSQVASCQIIISERFRPRQMDSIYGTTLALHEMGHCLGLAHTSDTTIPSVMQAVMRTNYKAPTDYDVTQIRIPYPPEWAGATVWKLRKSGAFKARRGD